MTTYVSSRLRAATAALVAAVGLSVGAAGLAAAHAGSAGSAGDTGDAARPTLGSTIVSVTGGYGNGFTVVHYDHTRQHLPTLSESMAECGEYDKRVQRVRCWSEVRTHYADLVEMRRAIQHQKDLRRHQVHATHPGHH